VYPLVRIYHRVTSWQFCNCLPFALLELMYRWLWASILHGIGLLLSHVIMISPCLYVSIMFYHPREYHLRSHWWSIQFGSSYPNRGGCPRHLSLRKFLFLSEHPFKWLDQEDWVMKHNTSRVMKHNPILQGTMSPTHGRKSGMGDREVFLLSSVPLSFLIRGQCVFHRFLCPLLRKSLDEISSKGGGL
jgi:hypothetical protein